MATAPVKKPKKAARKRTWTRMGQVDYALIVTVLAVGWAIWRNALLDQSLNEWIIMTMVFGIPIAIAYAVLKAVFIAMGVMHPI